MASGRITERFAVLVRHAAGTARGLYQAAVQPPIVGISTTRTCTSERFYLREERPGCLVILFAIGAGSTARPHAEQVKLEGRRLGRTTSA